MLTIWNEFFARALTHFSSPRHIVAIYLNFGVPRHILEIYLIFGVRKTSAMKFLTYSVHLAIQPSTIAILIFSFTTRSIHQVYFSFIFKLFISFNIDLDLALTYIWKFSMNRLITLFDFALITLLLEPWDEVAMDIQTIFDWYSWKVFKMFTFLYVIHKLYLIASSQNKAIKAWIIVTKINLLLFQAFLTFQLFIQLC